jgi:hypothetical protein
MTITAPKVPEMLKNGGNGTKKGKETGTPFRLAMT